MLVQIGTLITKSDNKTNGFFDYNSFQLGNTKYAYPYAKFADENGNPLPINYRYGNSYTDTAGKGRLLDWKYRPLAEMKNSKNQSGELDVVTNINGRFEFYSDLIGEVSFRYEQLTSTADRYYSTETFLARNLINLFTQFDGNTTKYVVPLAGILESNTSILKNTSLRGQLNYSKVIGTNHRVQALAGAELTENKIKNTGQRYYGYDGDKLGTARMDYLTHFPYYTGGTSTIPALSSIQEFNTKLVSFFSNAAYTLYDKYILTASARQDASNLFGVEARNKWKPLWSAGIAWNIYKEKFYESQLIPYLNLRVTYGFSGNVNNSIPGLTTILVQPANAHPANVPFATLANIPNPDLSWEKLRTINYGLDFSTKNRKVTGSIEYYTKKSSDVIGLKFLDPTTGVSTMKTNSANVKGNGIDVSLTSRISPARNFIWTSTLNFSYAYYKVSKYLIPKSNNSYYSDGSTIFPVEGLSPFEVVSFRWAGLDKNNGNPMGYLNGKPSTNIDSIILYEAFSNLKIHGPNIPKYFGNLLNTFTWKGVTLSANISYRLGYYFRRSTINYESLVLFGKGHSDYAKRWQNPGDEIYTNIPSMIYPDPTGGRRDVFFNNSEITVERGDHIRIEDLRLSYNLDKSKSRKLPFNSMQIFLYSSNLNIIIWKANKLGIDPDYPNGMRLGKSLTVGLSITL